MFFGIFLFHDHDHGLVRSTHSCDSYAVTPFMTNSYTNIHGYSPADIHTRTSIAYVLRILPQYLSGGELVQHVGNFKHGMAFRHYWHETPLYVTVKTDQKLLQLRCTLFGTFTMPLALADFVQ